MKTFAVVVFIAMYSVMIFVPSKRPHTALAVAALFAAVGILPFASVFSAVDWNVIMMIAGTMVIVDYFIESKMPSKIADYILDLCPNVMWVTIAMSLFAGFISAFIDNVATVLMVAPVGLVICKKLKISPVAMIIAIAVSSNLQGAATLVGDTTSILLGAFAKMDFLDFFWMNGRPGIFFAVQLGAAATVPIMMFLFRDSKAPVSSGSQKTAVTDLFPSVMMAAYVLLLICASFIPGKPEITNGVISVICAAFTTVVEYFKTRSADGAVHAFKSIEWETILMLIGLFTVIGGITNVGIIDDLAKIIVRAGNGNVFLTYTVIVWGSVAISCFVDNIPYVATMLPVITSVNKTMDCGPYLLFFGLLIGATLGGNLSPIGASANITAFGMLRSEGEEVGFSDFMKIGVPFTLAAVVMGYAYIWIFWR